MCYINTKEDAIGAIPSTTKTRRSPYKPKNNFYKKHKRITFELFMPKCALNSIKLDYILTKRKLSRKTIVKRRIIVQDLSIITHYFLNVFIL